MEDNDSLENNSNEVLEDKKTDNQNYSNTKFCKHCGEKIPKDAVICTKCGRQVEELKDNSNGNIIINNSNNNVNSNANINTMQGFIGRRKDKWVAICLCLFLGVFGAHKFYEGKILIGIIYMFTGGLFFIGIILDFLALLSKPNPYYV